MLKAAKTRKKCQRKLNFRWPRSMQPNSKLHVSIRAAVPRTSAKILRKSLPIPNTTDYVGEKKHVIDMICSDERRRHALGLVSINHSVNIAEVTPYIASKCSFFAGKFKGNYYLSHFLLLAHIMTRNTSNCKLHELFLFVNYRNVHRILPPPTLRHSAPAVL